MVHIAAPPLASRQPTLPIFYNLDASVGAGGENSRPDDIMLVQFMLKKIGERSNVSTQTGADASGLRNTMVTGAVDANTIDAIMTFQQIVAGRDASGIAVDGRINTAKGGAYGFGNLLYSIVHLNATFKRRYWDDYLLIDRFPDCPGILATGVKRALLGSPTGE